MDKSVRIEMAKARENMYRFLGCIYLMEVDAKQLSLIKKMNFPEITGTTDADMDLQEGYTLIANFAANCKCEEKHVFPGWDMQAFSSPKDDYVSDLDDLAADFAKVFLAAGDATGHAAFPYESVYVDKRHQVGGSTEMQMKALYLERGFEPDPNMYHTMYDHVGLMMEYMGILCGELAEAFALDDNNKALELLEEQKQFVRRHLVNWVYSFTSDIVKFSERDFYKGIAKITNGFLKKEALLLQEGGKIWDIA